MSDKEDKSENASDISADEDSSSTRGSPTPATAPAKSKKTMWGAAARVATLSKNQVTPTPDATPKKTPKSVAKRVNRQIKAMSLIKRWTQMTSIGQFAKDEEHLNYIRDMTKQTAMEIPAPIEYSIREEVLGILQETLKQYKLELGTNHALTQEMQKKIQETKDNISACIPKENRREGAFFKRLSNVFLLNE